jgi:hypothetical protein
MALAPTSSRGVALADANTWTGNQTAPAWIASGLTGATAASRYVGATASAAPASGTFAVGDFVIDQTGKVFVCTSAGTPGTWTQVGAGGVTVIDYTQFTSSVDIASTSEGSPTTIVTAGAHTFDGATLACIEFYAPGFTTNAVAGSGFFLDLYQDGTSLGRMCIIQNPSAGSGLTTPLFARRYLTPASGSRTYKIGGWSFSAADPVVNAGAGGTTATLPGYIRITSGS